MNDKQIGEYLICTKSPCMDIYREIIEILVTGKSLLLITIKFCYFNLNSNNYNFFYLVKRETNLINMFLATLTKNINIIEQVGVVESKLEVHMLMMKLACIWINCPHFQNYNYIIVLIKTICNMIMIEVNNNKNK